MPKINRIQQKIFASTAGINQIGKFGSLAAGSPATTTDADEVQSLSNFLSGWFSAVLGNNSPAIEDMNGLFYLITKQMAYFFQSGIPEWHSTTEYHLGSLVMSGGIIYESLVDSNTNNALTDKTKWTIVSSPEWFRTLTGSSTLSASTDNTVLCNASGGAFNVSLPAASGCAGKRFKIKKVDTTVNGISILPNGAELIDGATVFTITNAFDTIEVLCNGNGWYIV